MLASATRSPPRRCSTASIRWSPSRREPTSGPWHVLPREVVPRVWLARQPEYPLAEDVLVDLGGAAFDCVGAAAEHACDLERHALVGPRRRPHAEEVGGQQLQALVERSPVHLADRRGRARGAAGAHRRPYPLVGPRPDALLAVERHELLTDDGIVCA